MLARMLTRLRQWWQARQRRLDLEILWPVCKRQAQGDLELARRAFITHMAMTPAWRSMGFDEASLGAWVREHLV